jgi:hypothetical protein
VSGSVLGLVVTVVTVEALLPAQGIAAIPLGFSAGQGAKALVLAGALALRTRTVGAGVDRPGEVPSPA